MKSSVDTTKPLHQLIEKEQMGEDRENLPLKGLQYSPMK